MGSERLSWLWLACVMGATIVIAAIVAFSEGTGEGYGKHVGTALLLAGAASLLLVIRESTKDAKLIVVAASRAAALCGFSGASVVLYFESPGILFVLAVLVALLFITFLYGAHITLGMVDVVLFTYRKFRRLERGDAECVWCDNRTSPRDGICRACWDWALTGEWH